MRENVKGEKWSDGLFLVCVCVCGGGGGGSFSFASNEINQMTSFVGSHIAPVTQTHKIIHLLHNVLF